jgi:hypothetical protein
VNAFRSGRLGYVTWLPSWSDGGIQASLPDPHGSFAADQHFVRPTAER